MLLTKVAAVLFVTVLQRFTSRLDSVISVDVAASNFATLLSAIVSSLCKILTLTRTKSGVTVKRHNNQHSFQMNHAFASDECQDVCNAVDSMFLYLGETATALVLAADSASGYRQSYFS
jgi:anaerobic C4-dicarboxylate transporter